MVEIQQGAGNWKSPLRTGPTSRQEHHTASCLLRVCDASLPLPTASQGALCSTSKPWRLLQCSELTVKKLTSAPESRRSLDIFSLWDCFLWKSLEDRRGSRRISSLQNGPECLSSLGSLGSGPPHWSGRRVKTERSEGSVNVQLHG